MSYTAILVFFMIIKLTSVMDKSRDDCLKFASSSDSWFPTAFAAAEIGDGMNNIYAPVPDPTIVFPKGQAPFG